MKLSNLLQNYNVKAMGFPAVAGLSEHSKGDKPAVLSTLAAPQLFAQGITDYYSLVIPRGSIFKTTDDILAADPDVKHYKIIAVDTNNLPTAITTQHQGTLDILKELYPDAEVINQRQADGTVRNLTADDVRGKHIIGVLPPFLIEVAAAFTSTSIVNYNAATDGDLQGDELRQRLVIADQAITIEEIK